MFEYGVAMLRYPHAALHGTVPKWGHLHAALRGTVPKMECKTEIYFFNRLIKIFMKMKVSKINLHHLPNDVHFQFMTEFRKLVERFGAVLLGIEQLFALLMAQFNDEDTVLKKVMKSVNTVAINGADKRRDEIWHAMSELVKLSLHHYLDDVRKAAYKLSVLFATYGNIARQSLDAETSAIYNILQDLRGKYAEQVAKIAGLADWITELEAANIEVDRLMSERYDETAARTDLVMREVRLKIDDAYDAVTERINAAIVMEGDEKYREFVTTLNAVIKRYNDIQAQRKGRAAAKKEKKEDI
jgi:hypothetical protein